VQTDAFITNKIGGGHEGLVKTKASLFKKFWDPMV
jgi:hypothetical protein